MAKRILFHSTTGGIGRTMMSVAVATFLTKFGRVAYIDATNTSEDYWLPSQKNDKGYRTVNNINHCRHLTEKFDLSKIHLYGNLIRVLNNEKDYDFIVFNGGDNAILNDKHWGKMFLAVDIVVMPMIANYRSVNGTIRDAKAISNHAKPKYVIPVHNMDEGRSEHDLGESWDQLFFEMFNEFYSKLSDKGESLFHNLAIPRQPFIGFGNVNVALQFGRNSLGWPGTPLANLTDLIVRL